MARRRHYTAQDISRWNHVWRPGVKATPDQIRAIAEYTGLARNPREGAQAAQIARGESSGVANIVAPRPDDQGLGLFQNTPYAHGRANWGPEALAHYRKLGGRRAMMNPVTNAKMAKYLKDHSGGGWGPWYGTRYLNRSQGPTPSALAHGARGQKLRGGQGARGGGSGGYGTDRSTTVTHTPGVDNSALRKQLLLQYLSQRGNPDALLSLGLGLKGARDVPGSSSRETTTRRTGRAGRAGGGGRPDSGGAGAGVHQAWRRVQGHPIDRPGAKTDHKLVGFAARMAAIAGGTIQLGTGTNHNRMTTSGNVSDHWAGNAVDLPASGQRLTRMGQAALIAAGMDPKQARRAKGGVYNVNGWQVLFNTHVGGNHYNHVHVGHQGGRIH